MPDITGTSCGQHPLSLDRLQRYEQRRQTTTSGAPGGEREGAELATGSWAGKDKKPELSDPISARGGSWFAGACACEGEIVSTHILQRARESEGVASAVCNSHKLYYVVHSTFQHADADVSPLTAWFLVVDGLANRMTFGIQELV